MKKMKIAGYVLMIVIIVVSIFSCISLNITKNNFRDMETTFNDYRDAYKAADDFQNASDYLTEQVRKYVVTLNEEYVFNYFNELNNVQRRENALNSLNEMSKANKLESELFEDALNKSNLVKEEEIHAMKLMAMVNLYDNIPQEIIDYQLSTKEKQMSETEMYQTAYTIVFGNEYNDAKSDIQETIRIAKQLISENTSDENQMSITKAEAAISMLNIYWILLVISAIVAIIGVNIYFACHVGDGGKDDKIM